MEYGSRVIGIEILIDMMNLAIEKKKIHAYNNLELILAYINHSPIRPNVIDHILSVSAYNYIIHGREILREKRKVVNNTAKYLNRILKRNGRIIMEFYPKDDEELDFFKNSFTASNRIGCTAVIASKSSITFPVNANVFPS